MSEIKASNQNKEELTFEAAMARLEQISDALAKEGVSLEDSMKLYAEGVELVRLCNGKLDAAERQIKLLECNGDGELVEKDFPATDAV